MEPCSHVYQIAADGKTGVCKLCGDVKEFQTELTTKQARMASLQQTERKEYWRGRVS